MDRSPYSDLEPVRLEGELHPYVSGVQGDDPMYHVVHEIESMITWLEHYDRVLWAVKTTKGRIIVVMQQRHEDSELRGFAAGEVEIINAPFRDTATKGLREEIIMLRAALDAVEKVSGL